MPSAKLHRCAADVAKDSDVDNPWAVCNANIGEMSLNDLLQAEQYLIDSGYPEDAIHQYMANEFGNLQLPDKMETETVNIPGSLSGVDIVMPKKKLNEGGPGSGRKPKGETPEKARADLTAKKAEKYKHDVEDFDRDVDRLLKKSKKATKELEPLDSEYSYKEMREALITEDIKNLIKETFVVPLAQMDIGTRKIEPTPMGVEPAINYRDIPEDTPYYGPYGQWKKDYRVNLDNEEHSIYKEPIGQVVGSPNQQIIPPLYLPEPNCPCPVQMAEANTKKLARYKYNGHEAGEFCQGFDGKIFDLNNVSGRPVTPAEGLGFTNTHPNCQCTWEMVDPILYDDVEVETPIPSDAKHLQHINRLVGQKASWGTLHKVHKDGSVYKTQTDINPRIREIEVLGKKFQETVTGLKEQFGWLSDDFINHARESIVEKHGGRLMLIRAGSEAITDHRGEGEPLRRWLKPRELMGMARTGIGKGSDLNHDPNKRTEGIVLDSEFNDDLNQIQLFHYEHDPEVIQALENGVIDSVSINGGPPRQVNVECDGECFVVPQGVVLGESDGIAFTYVVTAPTGMMWKGQFIAPAKPGVKNTLIELL